MTGIIGAFVEAWDELRVHRLRVLLSLIGVTVAVMAMTSVTAAGQMLANISEELTTSMGKPATVQVLVNPAADPPPDYLAQVSQAQDEFIERYEVEGATRSLQSMLPFVTSGYLTDVGVIAVDQNWDLVQRVDLSAGRWFSARDSEVLAPPVVINSVLSEMMGHSEWTGPFAARIGGSRPATATVIGIVADQWESGMPQAYVFRDQFLNQLVDPAEKEQLYADLSIWIDPGMVDELQSRLMSELSTINGVPYYVEVYRQDVFGGDEFLETFQVVVAGIGILILGLSALNLLNIAIVTVRQRIREIGVRRALGASSGRVFFAIMMESVVATTVAGIVGIVGSVVLMRNLPYEMWFGDLPFTTPAYPVSAAITGLVASIAVGALCGLIPGLIAVRIRPIEAIRY